MNECGTACSSRGRVLGVAGGISITAEKAASVVRLNMDSLEARAEGGMTPELNSIINNALPPFCEPMKRPRVLTSTPLLTSWSTFHCALWLTAMLHRRPASHSLVDEE